METVLRAAAVYFFILLILRITGKRSLGEVTTFDFVLLLIISETTQEALMGDDFSVTNCFIGVVTLFSIDILMNKLKNASKLFEKISEDMPLIIVENGKPFVERMKKEDIEESDVLNSARESQGLERMDQIKYAVLERNGTISIIPQGQS
jgi:uncharacterized membrane protein YcaP (DUF421 family)